MKKIRKVVCLLLLTFVICFGVTSKAVYADLGMQGVLIDEVIVINPDGAHLEGYGKSIVIPYGEVLSVSSEEFNEIYVDYNGIYGYISAYDVKPVIDSLEPTEEMKNDEGTKYFYVYGNEAKLYKGPSHSFDVVEENIPVGTILSCDYSGEYIDSEWNYVEYKNNKGWIYYGWRNGDFQITEYVSGKGSLLANANLYDVPDSIRADSTQNVISSVDNEQSVKIICSYPTTRTINYYVKGNGIEGWVSKYDLFIDNVSKDLIYLDGREEEAIYSDRECTNQIGSMKFKGEYYIKRFGYIYDDSSSNEYDDYFYIPYYSEYEIEYEKGKYGFIRPENTFPYYSLSQYSNSKPATLINSHEIYSTPEFNDANIIGQVEAGEIIDYVYDVSGFVNDKTMDWIGVKIESGLGWIPMDYLEAWDTIGMLYPDNSKYISGTDSSNNLTSSFSNIGSSIDIQTIILIVGAVLVAALAGISIFFFTRKTKITK